MTSLILHSYRRCPFAIRVRMVLAEKNLSYTLVEEKLSNPSPELLRLNPQGKVPLLIHHGAAIPESAVITEYLDEVFPENPLLPANPLERARMRLWTLWCHESFKPDLDLFKYRWASLSPEEQNALQERLHSYLGKLTDTLSKQAYLLGEKFTLADIHIFPFYRQLTKIPNFSVYFQYPLVDAWLERILQRRSFEIIMKK